MSSSVLSPPHGVEKDEDEEGISTPRSSSLFENAPEQLDQSSSHHSLSPNSGVMQSSSADVGEPNNSAYGTLSCSSVSASRSSLTLGRKSVSVVSSKTEHLNIDVSSSQNVSSLSPAGVTGVIFPLSPEDSRPRATAAGVGCLRKLSVS